MSKSRNKNIDHLLTLWYNDAQYTKILFFIATQKKRYYCNSHSYYNNYCCYYHYYFCYYYYFYLPKIRVGGAFALERKVFIKCFSLETSISSLIKELLNFQNLLSFLVLFSFDSEKWNDEWPVEMFILFANSRRSFEIKITQANTKWTQCKAFLEGWIFRCRISNTPYVSKIMRLL